jgi:HlyD family secretion protein
MPVNPSWLKRHWEHSMLRRAMLVAPPVVLILLAGFWATNNRGPLQYYTAKVEEGDVIQAVQATGTIMAVTTVEVGSQVTGRIAALYADFNTKVTKGQLIAEIDPATFRARVQQTEADLENAQANVRALEAQIETQRADLLAAQANADRSRAQAKEAEQQLARVLELHKQGIFSDAQRDTAQSTFDSAQANLRVSEAQIEQSRARLKAMQAQLEQARAQVSQRRAAAEMSRIDLGYTRIHAPIDGIVIARNVDVGQTVAASLSAPTLFVIAQDLTKMQVYAKTDEADVGKIRPGAVATFRVDSFPREVFRGRVSQVRMNATTVQNVVTYDTVIDFDNPDQKLFPGMTAYVTIPVAWANNVIKIPNGALRFKPDISEEKRKELYAKYQIPDEDPAQRRLAAAKAMGKTGGTGGGGGFGGGGNMGARPGGGGFGGGGEGGQRMMGRRIGEAREQWGVVWKLLPDKQLQPVRVKIGVTDFTFTELKAEEGKEPALKAGDEVIIGQSLSRNRPQQQPGGMQQRPGGPMGPGGLPRRM